MWQLLEWDVNLCVCHFAHIATSKTLSFRAHSSTLFYFFFITSSSTCLFRVAFAPPPILEARLRRGARLARSPPPPPPPSRRLVQRLRCSNKSINNPVAHGGCLIRTVTLATAPILLCSSPCAAAAARRATTSPYLSSSFCSQVPAFTSRRRRRRRHPATKLRAALAVTPSLIALRPRRQSVFKRRPSRST